MPNNTKAHSDAIQEAARSLLIEYQIDITQQVIIPPLAKELARRMSCHPDTAKQHIARAVRRARGEEAARSWGGVRPGAGKRYWYTLEALYDPEADPQRWFSLRQWDERPDTPGAEPQRGQRFTTAEEARRYVSRQGIVLYADNADKVPPSAV